MKKTIILILVLCLLGGIWYFTQSSGNNSSAKLKYERDFKMENVDQIEKIFIVHKNGRNHTLIKNNPYWTIDDVRISPRAISNVLTTLKSLEIKYQPTKAAYENIMKHMIHSGIKIEVYGKNDKELKVFYIGGTPSDEMGTYAIMDGSTQPFVVQRKFIEGSIRPVFQLNVEEWKDKGIFRLKPDNIKSIKVAYPYDKQNSFILINHEGSDAEIHPLYEDQKSLSLDPVQGLIDVYLSKFKEIYIEGIQNDFPLRDSVNQLLPFCSLELLTTEDEIIALKLYPKDEMDRKVNMDMDFWKSGRIFRYYAQRNNGDFIVLQQLNIGKALWTYPQFFRVKK